jgi:hypothetical protein
MTQHFKRAGRPAAAALAVVLLLPGCAMIPPAIEHGYTILSTIVYLSTSKGPADHLLSAATHKDCSLFRMMVAQPICVPISEDTNKPLLARVVDLMRGSHSAPSYPDAVVSLEAFDDEESFPLANSFAAIR